MLLPNQQTPRQPRHVAAGFPNSTVLVVDDDEHFRDLARGFLEPAGFQVIEAESAAQCLSQLVFQKDCLHNVDAVVLDLVMPERDGIEVVPDIRRAFPRTKIVTVSGARNSEVYLAVSARLGADASLPKSEIASLCALLGVVLDAS